MVQIKERNRDIKDKIKLKYIKQGTNKQKQTKKYHKSIILNYL